MSSQNKIYVGNFPFSWTEADLEDFFNDLKDQIADIKIIYDRSTGRSKGFGFVSFNDEDGAAKALKKNNTMAGERSLLISYARPMEERPARNFKKRDFQARY